MFKFVERRLKIREFIDKQRFLKLSTLFMFALVLGFTGITFTIFVVTGSEPSTLVEGFFDFVKWEFAGLSLIKISENFNSKDKRTIEKVRDIVTDGEDVLESANEFIDSVKELGSDE